MAAKSSLQQFIDKLAEEFGDTILVNRKQWETAMEDKKWLGVINWDTIFDDDLKSLLMLHFLPKDKDVKKLFEPSIGGPLVSLTHKTRLAYALGIIDKMALNDFENIHNIRNKFAHNKKRKPYNQ